MKYDLKSLMVEFSSYGDAFQQISGGLLTPPSGVLLHVEILFPFDPIRTGPPGCAKTSLVKAIATDSKANFISFNVSDLILSEVGESEKKIQHIFKVAKEYSPCIVFFDEIQAIFGNKDFESEYGRKVCPELFCD